MSYDEFKGICSKTQKDENFISLYFDRSEKKY